MYTHIALTDITARSNLYYDLPPMTEKERREERKYLHVENDM